AAVPGARPRSATHRARRGGSETPRVQGDRALRAPRLPRVRPQDRKGIQPRLYAQAAHGVIQPRLQIAELALVLVALVVSGLHPADRTTWWLEVFPILIALPILLATYRRFPLTDLLYALTALHALVLILGGAYTYAHVPLGFWMQEWFDFHRNHYDRIGHFMQGLVPALVTREILLRIGFVAGRRMAAFLSVCVALAVSAFYEL